MRTSHSVSGIACFILLAGTATGSEAQRLTPLQVYEARTRSIELAQQGQPDSALALLRRITATDSADANLWRRYGRLARQQRQWAEAVRALERAYHMGAFNRAVTALEIANIHATTGRPTQALNWLERASADRLQQPRRLVEDTAFVALRDSARFMALYPRAHAATLSRDQKWLRDIDFFLREAQRMHVHPERPAHSREFIDSIAALKGRVPTSNDMSIRLGLRRAIAMLRDGHSGMAPDTSMRMLPVDVYLFSDGVHVVNGIGEASRHVGSKVVAFGRKSVEDVSRAAAAYLTRDNDSDLRARLPTALANTAILGDIGVANGDGTVDVTLEDRNGKRSVERMTGGPLRRPLGLASPTNATKPFYLDRSRFYWTRDLPEARALYLNFNAVAEIDTLRLPAFSRRLAEQLRNPSYSNLIVDVRLNGGGNTFLLPPIIQAIASFAVTDSTRRVYVITSRHTYSAAQNFTSKLEWLLNPIFVGEPTGSAPNFTGEGTSTVLPYSGIAIGISNRMHMNSDWEDKRVWIAPHIPVSLSSADFFASRDPALQAIIAAASGTAAVVPKIDAVIIHPALAANFMCSEHPLGQEDHAGDALGQDCTVVREAGGPNGSFSAFYSGDGTRNTDWFSWNEPLLAPFDGIVKAVHTNPVTNQPGWRGSGMASLILFERIGAGDQQPVQVGYVHVQDVQVAVGDTVVAGQQVARIGNNGISDHPHVHIGAVRGDLARLMSGAGAANDVEALQIRVDLAALGRLRGHIK